MTLTEAPEVVTAACVFGAQRLLPLLDAFSKEIEGVKTAHDIEHIHRMRVASRRLRAALPLFASCIPEKRYRSWMQGMQTITRALGDARDTDVQIAFLVRLIETRESGRKVNMLTDSSRTGPAGDVETLLLNRLKKKRQKIQVSVMTALEKLERSSILDEMKTFFTGQVMDAKRRRKRLPTYGISTVAASRISRRLNTLLAFEVWVHNPDAILQHHAMRISAKKLRYTLEVYAPLYRLGLKKYHARVKKIQEILGDLHDCDVWIDTMMVMLLKARSAPQINTSSGNRQESRIGGYRRFLSERERERRRFYRQFVTYWNSLGRAGTWDELKKTLVDGRNKKFQLPPAPPEEHICSSVATLATQCPEVMAHSQKVTELALSIFDGLAELHRMGSRERFLLECAGSLHDIGWKFGQKGHAKRSAGMILADENLLLDIRDRGIIALVCRAHRGKARFESEGVFSLLSSKDRDIVLMLTSLLRIADGLDYSHNGLIESVHCTVNPEKIVIEVSAHQDISTEIERARLKGDLFTRVFNRELVMG